MYYPTGVHYVLPNMSTLCITQDEYIMYYLIESKVPVTGIHGVHQVIRLLGMVLAWKHTKRAKHKYTVKSPNNT